MNLPILFRSAARAEFDEATAWYEQRHAGLGREFVAQIQHVLDSIAQQPSGTQSLREMFARHPRAGFPIAFTTV